MATPVSDLLARKRKGFVDVKKMLDSGEYSLSDVRSDVLGLMAQGRIAEARTTKVIPDGGEPPLRAKYHILAEPVEPFDASGLCPRLASARWLELHPADARAVSPVLHALSDALESGSLRGMDHREAAYALCGNEKALETTDSLKGSAVSLQRLLSSLGVSLDDLGVTRSPWPVTMEVYPQGDVVVVTENATPYHRLCEIGRNPDLALRSWGFVPAAVVFGGGRGANRSLFVSDVVERAGSGRVSKLLYWGDIDRPGVSILCSLLEQASGVVPAGAWNEFYSRMLEACHSRAPRDGDSRAAVPDDLSCFDGLTPLEQSLIRHFLERGLIIPQECLGPAGYLKEA